MWSIQKQKGRAVLPKPKWTICIDRSQKVFEPDPNPNKSFKGPKKCQKGPKFGQIKNEISPKGQKKKPQMAQNSVKEAHNVVESKTKR